MRFPSATRMESDLLWQSSCMGSTCIIGYTVVVFMKDGFPTRRVVSIKKKGVRAMEPTSVICLVAASVLMGVALVMAVFALIVKSQGGAVGFFVVAALLVYIVSMAITAAGFIPGVTM